MSLYRSKTEKLALTEELYTKIFEAVNEKIMMMSLENEPVDLLKWLWVSWTSIDYKGNVCVSGEPQAVALMGLINGLCALSRCTGGGAMYSFSAAFIMKCAFKQNKLRGKYNSAWCETDGRYHHLVKFQANEVLKLELAKLQKGSAKFALTIGGRDFKCHMSRDPEVVERQAVARSQERDIRAKTK
jgi:hypothetical protein